MSADFHHLPAALTLPRRAPAPVAFPERPPGVRTTEPSESTRARWARMGMLAESAKAEGHAQGLRDGYTQGWRWGLWCGATAGALLASLAWAVWLTVTAPQAAPASASPALTSPTSARPAAPSQGMRAHVARAADGP